MKIKKLTITMPELNQAVQAFLKTKGIDLPVESVSRAYGEHPEAMEVEFVEDNPQPKQESPEPEIIVALKEAA